MTYLSLHTAKATFSFGFITQHTSLRKSAQIPWGKSQLERTAQIVTLLHAKPQLKCAEIKSRYPGGACSFHLRHYPGSLHKFQPQMLMCK